MFPILYIQIGQYSSHEKMFARCTLGLNVLLNTALHAKNVFTEYEAIVIVCEDTDVLLLAISKAAELEIPIYQKRGTQNKTRYINVTSFSKSVGERIAASLPGIHAFTGCDTVSSFAGKGKKNAFKLLKKSTVYQEAFVQLGAQLQVPYMNSLF